MKGFRFFSLFFAFSIFIGVPSFSENNRLGVPDSSDIRKIIAENWFEESLSQVRDNHTELRSNSIGQVFQVRLEETRDIFSIIVAPETQLPVDLYTQDGIEHTVPRASC